jgi:hypothetical protein
MCFGTMGNRMNVNDCEVGRSVDADADAGGMVGGRGSALALALAGAPHSRSVDADADAGGMVGGRGSALALALAGAGGGGGGWRRRWDVLFTHTPRYHTTS